MTDPTDDAIVRRQFDTREDPTTAVAETVAELEGRPPTDMTTMYDCIDHVLDHLFANPPSPDAQVQVEFTYEGYRITVDQNGTARFVEMSGPGS